MVPADNGNGGQAGGEIAQFTGDISKFTFDAKGNLVMTFVVSPENKWAALPLTDIRGRRFLVTISASPGRAARVRQQMALAPIPPPAGEGTR